MGNVAKESIFFARSFLDKIRNYVDSKGLKIERLPKWIKAANIRVSKINNSTVIFFEESVENKDCYTFQGKVISDLQFLLDIPERPTKGASLKSAQGKKLIILSGEHGEKRNTVFNVSADALFDVGYVPYHSPIAIFNIFLNLVHVDEVLGSRFIPCAIYAHEKDTADIEEFWDKCTPHLQDFLHYLHDSEEGDYYQRTTERKESMLVYNEKSVIVFGKDSDATNLAELCRVRDYLKTRNYEAYLLKELPEHPLMSNEEKAKFWVLASRFCVMVDREPSGHIAEYNYLKGERAVLAFMRPKGKGSTYMIGDDSIVEVNHVKIFEFEDSPLQMLDAVIDWAETFIEKKIEALKDAYPWR